MQILLTGANGCLGRALLQELATAGHGIVAVVRPGSDRPSGNSCDVVEMDLRHSLEITRLPARCDAVVHVAQSREYRKFPQAALDIFRVNTAATMELANYAVAAGAQHLHYASTGTVYKPHADPIPETAPVAPSSFYTASKLAAEQLLTPFGEVMTLVTTRLFYLYGPGQGDGLINQLVQRVMSGTPVDLQGPEGFLLCPTYSGDVARFIRRSLEEKWSGIYNVASSEVITLRDLTVTIADILRLNPIFRQSALHAPTPVLPDLNKLKRQLPATEFISISDGLRRTFPPLSKPTS